MRHLCLDGNNFSVRFDCEGVMIDLGAIGKGYAIDCAARTLREAGVTSALLHGGTSTSYAIGAPPEAEAWQIAVASPPGLDGREPPARVVVRLRDEALSVSAVWGRSFEAGGKTYGHVLDPRTGRPGGAGGAGGGEPSFGDGDGCVLHGAAGGRAGGRRADWAAQAGDANAVVDAGQFPRRLFNGRHIGKVTADIEKSPVSD